MSGRKRTLRILMTTWSAPEDTGRQTGGPFSLADLARVSGGSLCGDGSLEVRGIAELDKALPGDITYAVDRRYAARLEGSMAGAAIVPATMKGLKLPHIVSQNPYLAFARVLALFTPVWRRFGPTRHPSAIVAPDAIIGRDVHLGACAVISDEARLGDRVIIEAGVVVGRGVTICDDSHISSGSVIHDGCFLGSRVRIHSGTVIGSDGYGFVTEDEEHHKIPQLGIVVIEDDVEIGACVTIDRATIGQTRIGKGTKIDNLVQIGHNTRIGPHCLLVAQVGISGSTTIEASCRFAGQSGTSGHLTVGRGSTLAARAVATRDLAPGSFVLGFPAQPHKEELRVQAAARRVPDLLKRIRVIEEKLVGTSGVQLADPTENPS